MRRFVLQERHPFLSEKTFSDSNDGNTPIPEHPESSQVGTLGTCRKTGRARVAKGTDELLPNDSSLTFPLTSRSKRSTAPTHFSRANSARHLCLAKTVLS